jgi:hypothetical protein
MKMCEANSPVGLRTYYHCSLCDLVYLDPDQRLSSAAELEQYNLHENSPDDPRYVEFLRQLTDPLFETLKSQVFLDRKDPKILDFGSGPTAVLSKILGDAGYIVNCYDPYFTDNSELLKGKYDVITSTEVVEHIYDPSAAFELLNSILAEDAYLFVMTGMKADWENFAGWHYRRELTHVCFFSHKTMEWIAHKYQWELKFPAPNVAIFKK